jgi:hypothetical protein
MLMGANGGDQLQGMGLRLLNGRERTEDPGQPAMGCRSVGSHSSTQNL